MASNQIAVVPILRRYWLLHTWTRKPETRTAVTPTLGGKARAAVAAIQAKAGASIAKQWDKVQAARPGTLNHQLFRLANYVLERVDPQETFLKGLPCDAASLEVAYPASLPERLVRRRLRLLCQKLGPLHAQRTRYWALGTLPQLPLMVLPLPNITIYYSVWRVISNRSAAKGAAGLLAALEQASDVQRWRLAQRIAALQQQGLQLRPGEWPARLVDQLPQLQARAEAARPSQPPAEQLRDSSDEGSQTSSSPQAAGSASSSSPRPAAGREHSDSSSSSSSSAAAGEGPTGLPMPIFTADTFLERVVQPAERLASPLPEAAVQQLVARFQQPTLLDHYHAANRKCLSADQLRAAHERAVAAREQRQAHEAGRSGGSS